MNNNNWEGSSVEQTFEILIYLIFVNHLNLAKLSNLKFF